MSIPNFISAETAYLTEPPAAPEQCESGDCDECAECLAIIAEDEAEALAYEAHKERRWERG